MNPLRILLVDDHADSATALARLLHSDGHHVTTANTMTDAVIAAAGIPVLDMVISDIGLPDGDGCALLALLRERVGIGPGAAIALTGDGEEEWEARCREAGFSRFLTKPVVYENLLAAIAEFTPPQSPRGSSKSR